MDGIFIQVLTLSVAIVGLIAGTASLVLSLMSWAEIKALKNSTHSIQYVSASQEAPSDEKITKNFVKAGIINEPFDSQPDEVIL